MADRTLSAKIKVGFEYSVHFGYDVFSENNPILGEIFSPRLFPERPRALFLVDKGLAEASPALLGKVECTLKRLDGALEVAAPPLALEAGESFKTLDDISHLCSMMAEQRLCRHSFVMMLGGGAFLDKIGLAASLVHRGLRQIRFPSTVLSQCDSGVGVKNGINMMGKKNLLGTFHPPFAVVNDFKLLETLGRRDWISGIAEAFKVSIIKDKDFFHWLCGNAERLAAREMECMQEMIVRCAEIHLDQIVNGGDPFEFGSSKPLDFGHWSAHRLESLSNGSIRHGEAVAIGIALDANYAFKIGLFDEKSLKILIKSLKTLGFSLWNETLEKRHPDGTRMLFDGIEEFREHLGGELHISMPDGLGSKIEVHSMDKALLEESISDLRKNEDS